MADQFVSDAMECVRLRIVYKEADFGNCKLDFEPLFCHQFFGENEAIYGYSGLSIKVLSTPCDCQVFVDVKYISKVAENGADRVKADDILDLIKSRYPNHGVHDNIDSFRLCLDDQYKMKPFGDLIHAYNSNIGNKTREFQIHKIDSSNKNVDFVHFYERLEMFAFWFIDAASCVDTEDDRWQYYLLYEKYLDASQRTCYAFVGYSSVYFYYAYPEHLKPRIGHFLVLPPFQKCGHGFRLLQSIYNDLIPDPRVLEISAEDPAEEFVKLRNFVDATNCQSLAAFSPLSRLKTAGFTKALVQEAREKLKMGKLQARRIYEILRLKATDASKPDEFKAYRLDVKQRLYKPFKKSRKDWRLLNKVLTSDEVATAAALMTRESVHLNLQALFEHQMQEYRPVLDRLSCQHRDLPALKLGAKSVSSTTTNGHSATPSLV